MEFLSNEELYFSFYLNELQDNGYINSWSKGVSYPLGDALIHSYTEKNKLKEQTIIQASAYTPDFQINWNEKAEGLFYTKLKGNKKINTKLIIAQEVGFSLIETKGNYDFKQMNTLATVNGKWLYAKYRIVVNLIKVPDIFKKTFTPRRYMLTDSGRQERVIHFPVISLEEFVSDKLDKSIEKEEVIFNDKKDIKLY